MGTRIAWIVLVAGAVACATVPYTNRRQLVLVSESEDEKLSAAIRIGKEEGMQRFNDSLKSFIDKEYISRATAFEVSPNVEELKMALKGIQVSQPGIL